MKHDTAAGRWSTLDGARLGLLSRCERYAKFTIPKAFPDDNYEHASGSDQRHDYQAVGAQAVNHLTNKVMLALFAPSRPFFRLDPSDKIVADAAAAQVDPSKLAEILALAEKKAVKEMDKRALRPKLYDAIRQLIVTGNVLVNTEKAFRVMTMRYYAVKRNIEGKLQELLIREPVKFDELSPKVQEEVRKHREFEDDHMVNLYKWIKWDGQAKYTMTQWVDDIQLPAPFDGSWPEKKLPYQALTWDLSDDADYGTGHVEDYVADFAALSALSQSVIESAISASEFRWLVNPTGMTSVEDMKSSRNGGVMPGQNGDISILNSGTGQAIQPAQAVAQDYIQRIGRGFLLNSAVTRQAERVTAEEIRIQAQELETALGGAYSRLAVDFQMPMARYLLDAIDLKIVGNDLEPVIVTGLDALSRNGDLENLKLWLADLAAVSGLPPPLLQRIKMGALAAELAAARGIETSKFMYSEEEIAQAQQQQQAKVLAEQGAADAAESIQEQEPE